MKEDVKKIILFGLGTFLIILGILAFFNTFLQDAPSQVFWMSYITLILLGVSCFKKNNFLIASQINIIAIPYFFWDIDFIYHLKTGRALWGLTDYIFQGQTTLSDIISLQHFYTLPLAFLAFFLLKESSEMKKAWILSLFQIVIVFSLSRLLTPPELNINCVFQPCLIVHLPLPHSVIWFISFFSMIIITQVILAGLSYLRRTWDE